ncbi:hypothetical protein SB771_36875, partial [Burkholderia sp. SIMBA_051]
KGLDPANHLSEDSSEDDLYRAYRASVQVSFNALEQIDVLRDHALDVGDLFRVGPVGIRHHHLPAALGGDVLEALGFGE